MNKSRTLKESKPLLFVPTREILQQHIKCSRYSLEKFEIQTLKVILLGHEGKPVALWILGAGSQ